MSIPDPWIHFTVAQCVACYANGGHVAGRPFVRALTVAQIDRLCDYLVHCALLQDKFLAALELPARAPMDNWWLTVAIPELRAEQRRKQQWGKNNNGRV